MPRSLAACLLAAAFAYAQESAPKPGERFVPAEGWRLRMACSDLPGFLAALPESPLGAAFADPEIRAALQSLLDELGRRYDALTNEFDRAAQLTGVLRPDEILGDALIRFDWHNARGFDLLAYDTEAPIWLRPVFVLEPTVRGGGRSTQELMRLRTALEGCPDVAIQNPDAGPFEPIRFGPGERDEKKSFFLGLLQNHRMRPWLLSLPDQFVVADGAPTGDGAFAPADDARERSSALDFELDTGWVLQFQAMSEGLGIEADVARCRLEPSATGLRGTIDVPFASDGSGLLGSLATGKIAAPGVDWHDNDIAQLRISADPEIAGPALRALLSEFVLPNFDAVRANWTGGLTIAIDQSGEWRAYLTTANAAATAGSDRLAKALGSDRDFAFVEGLPAQGGSPLVIEYDTPLFAATLLPTLLLEFCNSASDGAWEDVFAAERWPGQAAWARHFQRGRCELAFEGKRAVLRETGSGLAPVMLAAAGYHAFCGWAFVMMGMKILSAPLDRRILMRELAILGQALLDFREVQKRWPRTFVELVDKQLLTADQAQQALECYRLSGTDDLLVQAGRDDVVVIAFERSEDGPWLLLTQDGSVVEAHGASAGRDLREAPDEIR